MGIKIRKALNEIISVHQRIINALKTQKVRQDQMLEKYQEDIEHEINIPSNKYLYWTRAVSPFMDSVISSKLMDYELIKQFEKFIKEIVQYEQEYLVSEAEIVELEDAFDRLVETVLHLEKVILDLKKDYSAEIIELRRRVIKAYQDQPDEIRSRPEHCRFCGSQLNIDLGDSDSECKGCAEMPDESKPFLRKIMTNQDPESLKPIIEPEYQKEPNTEIQEIPEVEKSDNTEADDSDNNNTPKPDNTNTSAEQNQTPPIKRNHVEVRQEKKLRRELDKLMVNYKKKYQQNIEGNLDIDQGGD